MNWIIGFQEQACTSVERAIYGAVRTFSTDGWLQSEPDWKSWGFVAFWVGLQMRIICSKSRKMCSGCRIQPGGIDHKQVVVQSFYFFYLLISHPICVHCRNSCLEIFCSRPQKYVSHNDVLNILWFRVKSQPMIWATPLYPAIKTGIKSTVCGLQRSSFFLSPRHRILMHLFKHVKGQ